MSDVNKDVSHSTLGRRGLLGAAGAGAATVLGAVAASPARAAGGPAPGRRPSPRRVTPGADIAAADGWSVFAGRRIGVITNPTGVVRDGLRSIVDVMVESTKVEVGGVFGPEHGFRGTAQAGSSEGTYVDQRTGVTVYDAYGASIESFGTMFAAAKVDTIVFDIQDVGARFYTYIWTMYNAMAAAAKAGLRFVVLDRPNPVGGQAKGPVLHPGYTSGVGLAAIAQQHGMTAGEIARFFNGELMQAVAGATVKQVQVVRVEGWDAERTFEATGLPWILPSPNMPTPTTAVLYPGTCLFEATNLSEGRGTTKPFELIGAPYVDFRWAERLQRAKLPGVEFREAYFVPTFSKWLGTTCGGVEVHVDDPDAVDAILTATTMMTAARDLYPAKTWGGTGGAGATDGFDWRGDAGRWVDLLTGSDRFRTMFTAGATASQIAAAWRSELAAFERRRRPYLLYTR